MVGGQRRDIVVVGASAGGVEALQVLVGHLPADLPVAVFVVLHIPSRGPRALAAILNRAGPLPVLDALPGQRPRRGTVMVAQPDRHLVFANARVHLSTEPAIDGHRPSIDLLFSSAASAFGDRVIGVVLSGSGDDGSDGLSAVAQAGGVAIVQDPEQAGQASMPRQALLRLPTAIVCRVEAIGPLIASLARASPDEDDEPGTLRTITP